jgi:hypothetical protein
MSLGTYAQFQAAIADQLARSDMTSQIVDCITLFEAEAARELFRNRRAEGTTIIVPSTPVAQNVSNAASHVGLIQLTVGATGAWTTGQELVVASVQGTTEANGNWIVTVIDGTHIDLQNSTFTNAYTSGGTVTNLPGVVTLPTDYMSYRRVTWTGSPNQELEYMEPTMLHGYYPLSQLVAGMPQYFTIEGNSLIVRPWSAVPIEFEYYQKTLALSGNLNWLFTNHVDAYWHGVLEQCYSYLKDYDQAGVYQQKKMVSFDEVKKKLFRELDAPTIRTLGPHP